MVQLSNSRFLDRWIMITNEEVLSRIGEQCVKVFGKEMAIIGHTFRHD